MLSLPNSRLSPAQSVTPVCNWCRLYPGCRTARTGLLPQYSLGTPIACPALRDNSLLLTSYCNYRGFHQRFIRIHLLHTYPPSLAVKELDSNAHHQLVTSPAALSGLLTLSAGVSEGPTLIVTAPLQGTHRRFGKKAAEVLSWTTVY